ncbi:FKBP-type peptidyl-prolyl cis-trans isomerase [Nonlabens antarcticus]|uniref:FKBP-type peptidyl-prolyl cis-trans isomerase n=1 Tax=Nonlabens antarcticus TaxID=392714 RepID=UPI001E4FB036|nr:peptidylprolyl isomerase [Nonlabens antarcticus]
MKKLKLQFLTLIAALLLISCGSDDDSPEIEQRDPQEVYLEDIAEINLFLNTHYWDQTEMQNAPDGADFDVNFKEIEAGDSSQIPLSQQVISQNVTRNGVDYQVYILKAREGEGTRPPTFADSALVSYKGTLLDGTEFDSSINSIWFDLPGSLVTPATIVGFTVGVTQFKDSEVIIPNDDGTISYKGSGIGAVFIPSGLGYFGSTQARIPAYSPLIFTFKLRKVKITDHDGDGILSVFEDLDGDGNLRSTGFIDNTDEDFGPGRQPLYNYIDADDDNDGILTKDENADPNGDGNPSDAKDTDGDGIPDYLDNQTEN